MTSNIPWEHFLRHKMVGAHNLTKNINLFLALFFQHIFILCATSSVYTKDPVRYYQKFPKFFVWKTDTKTDTNVKSVHFRMPRNLTDGHTHARKHNCPCNLGPCTLTNTHMRTAIVNAL